MRIGTAHETQQSIESISERRAELSRLQESIATGRRVLEPKDDALAAANAERLRASLARVDMEKRTIGFARQVLGQADGALSDANETLQSARELLVAASSSSYSSEQRAMMAQQLRGMRDQLLMIANRGDGIGNYLFGGQGTQSAPFVGSDPVTFAPQLGERQVGQTLDYSLSLDGNATFTEIQRPGAAPENIFNRLLQVARTLEDPSASAATVRNDVLAGMTGVDVAITSVSARRTQIGEQLRQIDVHESSLSSQEIQQRSYLSDLIDVDLAKAISEMSARQLALDASIKTYKAMSDLSMFRYI